MRRRLGEFDELAAAALEIRGRRGLPDPPTLTEREHAVLVLLPSLRPLAEIADELSVSANTVKTHVKALYSKLGVSSRRDAVDAATRLGLIRSG
ncbi:response regulator transcription factor [Pseudonocardia sp.]|jgi:LuxR family maltose regulon positive regulatory protein|uniref:response regulator transcription factor n=1 Tax=Pseudonocardia sp. TaxID=60912 RepID=UPI003D0B539E